MAVTVRGGTIVRVQKGWPKRGVTTCFYYFVSHFTMFHTFSHFHTFLFIRFERFGMFLNVFE